MCCVPCVEGCHSVRVWFGHGMAVKAMENVAKLNKHIQDSMPTSFECAICFEDDLKLPEDQVTTLPCTHKFCKDCFYDWAKSCRESRPWIRGGCVTCPLCRAAVPDANAPVVSPPVVSPPVFGVPLDEDMEPIQYRSLIYEYGDSDDNEWGHPRYRRYR